MRSTSKDISVLKDLIDSNEPYIMKRLFHYAISREYAEGSAALEEAWRNCVEGLSGSILKGIDILYPDFELGPKHDFRNDPLCEYIVETAKRHRERGISMQMFHGLMLYYKEAWLDLVRQAGFEKEFEAECLHIVTRMFDRFIIALCAEWSATDQSKQIEELQLRNRETIVEKNKFLTIFESVVNPIIIFDDTKKIINYNCTASSMMDASAEHGDQYYQPKVSSTVEAPSIEKTKIIGSTVAQIFPWLAEDIDAFVASDEPSIDFEKKIEKDKGLCYFSIKLSRRVDVSQTFLGGIAIFEEITEKKHFLEELHQAKKTAEAANRAKSTFLANMSHELRTPLNAILGYAQLMQRDATLQASQQGYLGIINRSGEHLLAVINDVLEISKIEAGRIKIEPVTFDLPIILDDIDAMFRIKTDARGLKFNTSMSSGFPRYVIADENKLRQILINLIGNATKFTEEGEISIRASTTGSGEKMRLVVEVEDTGMGIAREELEKVFQSFEQTESGLRSKGGTGLGLAISREYARLMSGDITATSTVGKGSTFRLEISIRQGSASGIKTGAEKWRVTALEPGQAPHRILVAEDNTDNRTLLTTLLRGVGFDVREALNGREAIEICAEWKPQFIWMDIRMPVMDGLEATRHIKATAEGNSTTIVAITAHALEEERHTILEAGCDALVHKPYREHEIFEVMAEYLGVTYLYEQTELSKPIPELSPGQLTIRLPQELRNELREAALRLNMTRTREVIEKIIMVDASVGTALKVYTERLDFEGLLDLLEDTASAPEGDV